MTKIEQFQCVNNEFVLCCLNEWNCHKTLIVVTTSNNTVKESRKINANIIKVKIEINTLLSKLLSGKLPHFKKIMSYWTNLNAHSMC